MEQKEFKLMSVNVISYLKMCGISPTRIEKNESGNVSHFFNNTNQLHNCLKEYKEDRHIQDFITKLTETRKQIKSMLNN